MTQFSAKAASSSATAGPKAGQQASSSFIAKLILLVIGFIGIVGSIHHFNSSDRQARNQIQLLETEKSNLKKEVASTKEQCIALSKQMAQTGKQIEELTAQRDELQMRVKSLAAELVDIKEKHEKVIEDYVTKLGEDHAVAHKELERHENEIKKLRGSSYNPEKKNAVKDAPPAEVVDNVVPSAPVGNQDAKVDEGKVPNPKQEEEEKKDSGTKNTDGGGAVGVESGWKGQ